MIIPATAANTWTSAEIAQLTPWDIRSIPVKQIKLLSGTQIPLFSIPQIRAFLPAQIKILSEAQIASLKTAQVYYMTVPQIQAFSPEQFASFKPQQVAGFTKSQIPHFTPAQVSRLDWLALATLNSRQLICFSEPLFSAFDFKAVSGFSAYQVSYFSEKQIQSLSEGTWQLFNLKAAAFAGFSAAQVVAFEKMTNFYSLSKYGFLNLTQDQISNFNADAVGALTEKELGCFTSNQLKALGAGLKPAQYYYINQIGHLTDLNTDNIARIPPDIIRLIGIDQITKLSSDQVAALTIMQLANMTSLQVQALNASGLTITQLNALDASGRTVLSELTPSQISMLGVQQLRVLSPAQISNLNVDAVGALTEKELGSFTSDQLKALGVGLKPAQYYFINQIGRLTDLNTDNIARIPPDIIRMIGSDQITKLSSDQVAVLTNIQLANMTSLQVQALNASGLTITQLNALDASGRTVLSELTPSQISNLTLKQLSNLSPIQIQSLRDDQVRALTHDQLFAHDASGVSIYFDLTTNQKNIVLSTLQIYGNNPYTGLLNILKNLEGQIGSVGLTDVQIQGLKDLLSFVTAAYGKNSYVGSILNSMINGDPAGHAGLSVNMTLNAYDAALKKWFLGTDNPTLIQGDHYVTKTNPLFSTSTTSTQMGSVISQGYYNGDCWLVAAIAATATVNPDLIKSMISDNGNGTYAVRFYNARTNTMGWVTVDNQLPSYTGVTDSDGTIWGGLIEKAYIVAQSNGIATSKAGIDHNSYIDNQYGWGQGLTAITGMKMSSLSVDNTALSKYSFGGSGYRVIDEALNKHETVLFASQTRTNYGLVEQHMFEVIGINHTNDHFVFQNPWGPKSHCTPFEVSSQQLAELWQANDYFLLGNYAGPGASNYNLGNTTAHTDPSTSLAASFFANQNNSLMG